MRPFRKRRAICAVVTAMFLASLPGTAAAAAPENDELANAKVIDSIPYSDVIDTTDATPSTEDPEVCRSFDPKTVWYRYTASESRRLVADTLGSDYDTVLAVFEGGPNEETLAACNDNWKSLQSRASFDAEAGQTYYFMVSGPGGELHFNLDFAVPPPNDDIENAKRISIKMPWVFSVDTSEATLDTSDPSCHGKSRSVWFKYVRPKKWEARQIELRTFGSDYDTTLSVYTGRPGNLQQIKCDDNTGGFQSKVRFKAEPGETYWVMVGSARNSPGGNLVLKAKQPPIPFKMKGGVDPTGSVSDVTGSATVTGFVRCSRRAGVVVTVVIRQKNGERVVSASGRRSVSCKDRRSWSLTLSDRRAFRPGSAGVWVTIEAPREDREKKIKRAITLNRCPRCV